MYVVFGNSPIIIILYKSELIRNIKFMEIIRETGGAQR